eukprot:TRINITY_DN1212_c0_g1_i6.p1 TRINITY_DN1212_c0_g1~~TRINITY_DN1212_c0_g1_i6.p1  ORF type:complete len:140 (+),score=13.20 TRINITY_DN1212_c0_g1_i6:62-421(+)
MLVSRVLRSKASKLKEVLPPVCFRSRNEYGSGPLSDLPDWSFADGTPAPKTEKMMRHERRAERILDTLQAEACVFAGASGQQHAPPAVQTDLPPLSAHPTLDCFSTLSPTHLKCNLCAT